MEKIKVKKGAYLPVVAHWQEVRVIVVAFHAGHGGCHRYRRWGLSSLMLGVVIVLDVRCDGRRRQLN